MKLLDLILPVRCVVCGARRRAALRGLPWRRSRGSAEPLCDRCGAPTAWPVARCRECAGRRLAFASARAAVAYDDGGPARSSRAWKERGLRTLAAEAAEVVVATRRRARARQRSRSSPPTARAASSAGTIPAERLARELGERW